MIYLLLVAFFYIALFLAWAILKAASKADEMAEKIEREEYQRRNDVGGKK
jgi:preprotein translocase subunit SecG